MTLPLREFVGAIAALIRRDRRIRLLQVIIAAGVSALGMALVFLGGDSIAKTSGGSMLDALLSVSLFVVAGAAGFIFLALRLEHDYRLNAAAAIACVVGPAFLAALVAVIPELASIPAEDRASHVPITLALAFGVVGLLGFVLAAGAGLGGIVHRRRMTSLHRSLPGKYE